MADLRVAVMGAAGNMGGTVCGAVLAASDLRLVARVDPVYRPTPEPEQHGPGPRFAAVASALEAAQPDVAVDFTRPEAALGNALACLAAGVAVVIGTTGFAADGLERLRTAAQENQTAAFVAPNFALGAVLMMQFAQQAARHLEHCEIVELHHERKLDAPSGTAARTGELVEAVWQETGRDKRVPIHSVRLPGLVAHQEVIFGGVGQTLTIRHDSLSRESFMPGVLLAIRRVSALQGLVVGLENLL